MRPRLLIPASLLLAAVCVAPPPAPAEDDAAAALSLVRKTYRSLTGLSADFTQTEERPGVGVSYREEGRLRFSPPDRLRWDYEGKTPHKVIINGSLVWMYTPSRNQVVKRTMTDQELRSGPATFLTGLDGVEESFTIQSRPAASADGYSLDLFPVAEQASFDKIAIDLAPGTGLVERLSIHHRLGNITTVTFRNFNTRAELADKIYDWDVPEGTEVVEP